MDGWRDYKTPMRRHLMLKETLTPRGWPVVATGNECPCPPRYYPLQALGLFPDESADFSFHDAFDLVEWAVQQEELFRARWQKPALTPNHQPASEGDAA